METTLTNPFAVLTFLVAPAILTNASAIMGMQTGTRFTMVLNRLSALLTEITQLEQQGLKQEAARRQHALNVMRMQAGFLTRAMMAFNLALAGFACSVFVSLIGAIVTQTEMRVLLTPIFVIAFVTGGFGVISLIVGGAMLAWETHYVLRKLVDNENWLGPRVAP